MKKLILIYFKECPNANHAIELLSRGALKYQTIIQDELASKSPYLNYTSPTLLCQDQIIFGSATGSGSGGCSLTIPTLEEIIDRIKQTFQ
jgi:hypothetical protein